jgi:hypothetical protein
MYFETEIIQQESTMEIFGYTMIYCIKAKDHENKYAKLN